jgi:SAM-dependent methyltransferase
VQPPEWWTTYFDDVFLRIYEPLLGAERTQVEVEAVMDLLGTSGEMRVLDVGCGWGRHSLELARNGYSVTGIDLSSFLIGEAERRSAEAGLDVRWVTGDVRNLNFAGEFDAAVSLFSSLGYFGSDGDDQRVLEGARRAVTAEGSLLLETMHRDLIAREYAERDWWETPAGDIVRVEREFDAVEGVSHETLSWHSPAGEAGQKRHSIRVRCGSEWKALLERSGWRPVEWFGSWDLDPFTHDSERLLILAHPR